MDGSMAVDADRRDGAAKLRRLAEYAATVEVADVPSTILGVAKGCLLYGLAVGTATMREAAPRAACAMLDMDGAGDGPSTCFLDGRSAAVGAAAFANAVLLSGRAQGDSHPAGHVGGVVIPAALALAQRDGLSGEELLASLIGGYETALRIGRDHAPALTRNGFRTTPCYGVFGAAAAGARALGLGGERTLVALSLSANLACGLREYVNAGTDESPFQAGFAARSGVSAALLAAGGDLRAAADTALHGPAGFYAAYGKPPDGEADRLCDGLGEEFELATVTYKPYPACQFLRGMIKSVVDLRREAAGADLAGLVVTLNPFEADFVGVRHAGPFASASQTLMSAPFCAALAWHSGGVAFEALRRLSDPAVLAIVPRVTVAGDPTLPRYATRVAVRLADGRELLADDRGTDADYRLDWDAAVSASRILLEEADVEPDPLIDLVADIERASDLSRLIKQIIKTTKKI